MTRSARKDVEQKSLCILFSRVALNAVNVVRADHPIKVCNRTVMTLGAPTWASHSNEKLAKPGSENQVAPVRHVLQWCRGISYSNLAWRMSRGCEW